MAIGALTRDSGDVLSSDQPIFFDSISLVGDNSYPTGGMLGVQAALQAVTKDQRAVLDVRSIGANGGYVPVWDKANGKLMCFSCAGAGTPMAEVANATNLSGVTFKLLVTSK
jgi:hypothetical protein